MSCPSEARLAAAVAGEDPAAVAHAEGCGRCAANLADGRAIRAALAGLSSPSPRRRAEALAEVLAEAERGAATSPAVAPRRPWRLGAAACAVAAMVTGAAAGVGAVRQRVTARHAIDVEVRRATTTAGTRPRGGVAGRAPARAAVPPQEVVPVGVAPAGPAPVDGPPLDGPPFASSAVAPPRAAPSSRPAPAGRGLPTSASTVSPPQATSGPRVERAAVAPPVSDLPPAPDPSLAPPAAPPLGVAAFQAGWQALRAAQPLVARAHFDRARDPAVAEDASYWAAVASERAGDRPDAARRYRSFARAFPASPRAADARAAAVRLDEP